MSKVTAKYQITLPVKVRKELGIVPGTEVDMWRGKFKDDSTTMEYLDEIRGPAN
jgi:AbrB family looped-hinge helix DNA binding protein